jgi:hypothetical protein
MVLASGSQTSAREVVPASQQAQEIDRIRSHFDSVLTELASRDVSMLSAAQRARRSDVMARLAAYRDRGVFPHNYDFPGQAMPYFVDRGTGTLCAVAHLMATDGHRDVVDRVATANNNVWVAELSGDSAFNAWLDDAGLTLAEAARIQVPYVDGGPGFFEPGPTTGSGYLAASALVATGALATTLVNATLNRKGNSRLGNALGFVAGVTSLGVGLAGTTVNGAWPVASAASALAGVASIGFSARGLVRRNHTIAVRRAEALRQQAARATIAPIVSVDGKAVAGMSLSIPF